MYPSRQRGVRTRNVFIGNGDSVGKPGGPPAERTDRDDGVVAERRDSEVHGGRVFAREDHVRRRQVLSTPANVVAEHDELDAFHTVGEVRHGAVEILGRRMCPAVMRRCRGGVVSSTNVNNDTHEVRSSPLCRSHLHTRYPYTVTVLGQPFVKRLALCYQTVVCL